jgi:hypothetical protein
MSLGFETATATVSDADSGSSQVWTGRLVSLRFFKGALRRQRWLWVGLAIVGLLCGIAYHVIVPIKYAASSTLYLAHPPGSDDLTVSGNDVALLSTASVGERAIKLLGEPNLNPVKMLGKIPGVAVSSNILTVTIDGPTPAEAIRRVNAVASAFLTFRAEQYNAQAKATDAGLEQQIDGLESDVNSLSSEIDGSSPIPAGQTLTDLINQRAQDSTTIIGLQQTIQQNVLAALSISKGSEIITPGIYVPSKAIKVYGLDGLSGLIVGLALGLGIVLVGATVSDRLRSREDIAAVLGAPVDLSVGRIPRVPRVLTFRRRKALAAPSIEAIVTYLRNLLPTVGLGQTLLLAAVDDVRAPAMAAAALAQRLSAEGKTAVLVDLTPDKALAHVFGVRRKGRSQVPIGNREPVMLLVPPGEWRPGSDAASVDASPQWDEADVILAVATVDPAIGAWHLLRWATRAIVVVTAGRSTAQRINGTAELLRAASVTVTSAILVNADRRDESIGLSDLSRSPLEQAVGALPPPLPQTWE